MLCFGKVASPAGGLGGLGCTWVLWPRLDKGKDWHPVSTVEK